MLPGHDAIARQLHATAVRRALACARRQAGILNMATVTLSINGAPVTADVEPRLHLADFLRGNQHLTGTHLGCEQGVCGACTVLIDGKPQRSCLAFTVDCDGATIRSIEDFDDDPLMGELRDAFSASHALQCGFCTPGMLASARDIVSRLGEVSEHRIREELSGNICRCTGYVGIVEAIRTVSLGKQPAIVAAASHARAEDHRTRGPDRSGRRYPGCPPGGVGVAHRRRRAGRRSRSASRSRQRQTRFGKRCRICGVWRHVCPAPKSPISTATQSREGFVLLSDRSSRRSAAKRM